MTLDIKIGYWEFNKMEIRVFTMLFFLFIFNFLAKAQHYQLSGTIYDQDEPVIGAIIQTIESNQQSQSDENGYFEIDSIEAGVHTLVVSHIAHSDHKQFIEIKEDVGIHIKLNNHSFILETVHVIDSERDVYGLRHLKSVENMAIYSSKKNEVIRLSDLPANKAANVSRQIFSKVSGLNIWESDGAGIQLGIGGRGLSPSRNSNFNTRQNGYDISADALGYPESYYVPPSEAVEQIEIVRGAASLQYGTQFGGMINFKMKTPPKDKKLQINSRHSVGSLGFINSFNSISGTSSKTDYYGFYQYKRSKGWQDNTSLDQHTAYMSAIISLSDKISLRTEYTHMNYISQQPGGLTDAQFLSDSRQSNRERNWFNVDWNLFALALEIQLTDRIKFKNQLFGLIAHRDALGNLDNINLIDFGENRDLLKDRFRNWGSESRIIFQYQAFDLPSTLLGGLRIYKGKTHRQQGDGDNGSNANFEYLHPDNLEGSDFDLPSYNLALFAENVFQLNNKWSVTPGLRYEHITTSTDGYYRQINKDLAGNIIHDERILEAGDNSRSFLFFGIGASYRPSSDVELYTNFSQNYRAINFNDIRVNVGNLVVDENLKDERGFNFELGARGRINKFFDFDLSGYYLDYNDRIGNILVSEPNPIFNGLVDRITRFRTNVADANIYGLESVVELHIARFLKIDPEQYALSIFYNLGLTHARYDNSSRDEINGNEVELVPSITYKIGLNGKWKDLSSSFIFGYTGGHFSDATNAVMTPTAVEGLIPSYKILDWSVAYRISRYELEAGINNVLNERYFTRRASGYPGPGIIPSSGRNFYVTFGIRI